jgi:hypothetical protein
MLVSLDDAMIPFFLLVYVPNLIPLSLFYLQPKLFRKCFPLSPFSILVTFAIGI